MDTPILFPLKLMFIFILFICERDLIVDLSLLSMESLMLEFLDLFNFFLDLKVFFKFIDCNEFNYKSLIK